MKVPVNALKITTRKILFGFGYMAAEVEVMLDVLMYAQLRGNNQGIIKLTGEGLPKHPGAGEIKVVKETNISALLDGNNSPGMVLLNRAVDIALEKARTVGISLVGTNNTTSSTGAIGYYANRIAQEGMVGFIFSGSIEYVAMYGSYEPLFGTNPLAIGIPSADQPIVFDMATSAIAYYGILEARTAGQTLPEGVAYDANGNPTIDPAEALKGAIRAFGGYKGAALGLIVEIFTHQLVDTQSDENGRKVDSGSLVIVIDPELLLDKAAFEESVSQLINRVKNTAKLPGVEEILVPGERGNALLQESQRTGEIEIEDDLWMAVQAVAERFN